MGLSLRALRPANAAFRLGDSVACPIELGQLLTALRSVGRPLACFRPSIDALGSSSAGILRAARHRQCAVGLLLDGALLPGRALEGALLAVASACDGAAYDLPLGLLVALPADAGPAAIWRVEEILDAGFPSLLLPLAEADRLAALSAPLRKQQLGWALEVSETPEARLAERIEALSDLGMRPAAIRYEGRALARAPGLTVPSWLSVSDWDEPTDLAAAARAGVGVVEFPLRLEAAARGERAEARAYFEADAALARWALGPTAAAAVAALLRQATE